MATADIGTREPALLDRTASQRSEALPTVPHERIWVGIVALVGAVPSLVAGLTAGFMTDDWGIWLSLDERSLPESLHHVGFEQPGRLLAGPYYVLLYEVIGDVPWVQGLLIGAINAAVVVAAWLVGRRFLPATVLWPALVVLALAPNHAMTRIWFVAGYYALSLAIVLIGLWLLVAGRWRLCVLCFVTAALLFEGVLGLGLAGLGLWALADLRRRSARTAAIAFPTLFALGIMYVFSSKRSGVEALNNAGSLFSGQLGVGLWGSPTLARFAGGAVLLGLTWAIARQLPSFRTDEPEPKLALLGVALAFAGATPFLLTGFTFATRGVFDRNNLAASVGVAVLLGALWSKLWRSSRVGAGLVGAVVGVVFIIGQAEDLRNWIDAYDRGEAAIERLAEVEVDDSALILVVPEQDPENTGVADFIYDADLIGAMRYRQGGDWSGIRLIEGVACEEPVRSDRPVQVVDWRTGAVRLMTAGEIKRDCERLRRG